MFSIMSFFGEIEYPWQALVPIISSQSAPLSFFLQIKILFRPRR